MRSKGNDLDEGKSKSRGDGKGQYQVHGDRECKYKVQFTVILR